ncbi:MULTISPECIES: monovalent cation/H+ antiporter subunit D [unclassified Methylophaga]|jgi:multicomponent K+:H+ antiporter subunit D|uniref:monovalent cation/H+ antiporter subunit D n=1 Tax=unclassified Methylophaga TaxID=2629249 RepID=UPI000C92478D|nr:MULTISPECIES: monovalent cation/H+ antiporter subunit D [unclassified Methylophaga]MAK65974.1 monovalent cation/H+ antiporter subunit D [Methylophaga sp.]MAY18649.1 monovalent cation/H+ antiporter subunit D [Methylophaga sp.]|tara:strand:+ start:32148 stop:33674 length:1527 start_codon:yes stop_codon:yes gene_type:complete
MSPFTILPVLLPLIGGILLLMARPAGIQTQRILSLILISLLVGVSLVSFKLASTDVMQVVLLGNWQAPFGIVIVLDRLSAMMLLLTSLLALAALWYAIRTDTDKQGQHFHVLFQLQLFGLNGAFMTGDVFNLFVFFEVLLLASYGLLLHGGGRLRTRAGLHYVVINLVGSTLFLFAVGTLYGILGTLNIADMAIAVQNVSAEDQGIVATAAVLLLVVFGIKAAMFPLYLWLPGAYAYTSAPVAALFAIMTKVGLYSIIRVHGTVFGEAAGDLAFVHIQWVLLLGLITLTLAALGVLAARALRRQVAYLILASVATLMIAIGINSEAALTATFYYLIHSTLLGAAMFLIADVILRGRGIYADSFTKAIPVDRPVLVGSVFMLLGIALTGMPPLSGFFGKVMILNSALAHPWFAAILSVVLIGGLIMIIAVCRSGSLLFYSVQKDKSQQTSPLNKSAFIAVVMLMLVSPLMVIFAKPLNNMSAQIAAQLYDQQAYINAVLDTLSHGETGK